MQIIEFNSSTRSYSTREKAVQAAEKLLTPQDSQHGDRGTVRVIIQSQYGRFSPCFVLTGSAMHLAAPIASRGFQVIG